MRSVDEFSEQIIRRNDLSSDRSCYCWQCGYEWISRKKVSAPAICPRCRSDNWNVYRCFKCQHFGHIFTTADLYTPAYELFQNCSNCQSSTWHRGQEQEKQLVEKEQEEWKKRLQERLRQQEEQERLRQQEEQIEKRMRELNIYVRHVEAFRPYSTITLIRILILISATSILLMSIAISKDPALQLEQHLISRYLYYLGFSSFIFLLSYLYPRKRSLDNHKLNKFLSNGFIIPSEAEWIKKQFPSSNTNSVQALPSKNSSATPVSSQNFQERKVSPKQSAQTFKSQNHKLVNRPPVQNKPKGKFLTNAFYTVIIALLFLIALPLYVLWKIFTWLIKYFFSKPSRMVRLLLPGGDFDSD